LRAGQRRLCNNPLTDRRWLVRSSVRRAVTTRAANGRLDAGSAAGIFGPVAGRPSCAYSFTNRSRSAKVDPQPDTGRSAPLISVFLAAAAHDSSRSHCHAKAIKHLFRPDHSAEQPGIPPPLSWMRYAMLVIVRPCDIRRLAPHSKTTRCRCFRSTSHV
jgi:hypothetical protein